MNRRGSHKLSLPVLFLCFCFLNILHEIAGLAVQNLTQSCDCLSVQTAGTVLDGGKCSLSDQLLLANLVGCVTLLFQKVEQFGIDDGHCKKPPSPLSVL